MKPTCSFRFFFITFSFVLSAGIAKLYAQNLVPNPGFELYMNCPTNVENLSETQLWVNPIFITTPDYFNTCATNPMMGVPANFNGNENAHTGNGYAGIVTGDVFSGWMEYIQIQLISPLTAGQSYTVSFWASCAEDDNGQYSQFEVMGRSSNLSAMLSTTPVVEDPNLPFGPLPGVPQLTTAGNVNTTNGWEELTWDFVATGGENYLTIGRWDTGALGYGNGMPAECGMAYYYIDDVSIVPINTTEPVINSISATSSCFGMCDGTASVTVTGGVTPYSYDWTGNPEGEGTNAISGLCPGEYTVVVYDGAGNTTSGTVTVTENPEIIVQTTATPVTNCTPYNGTVTTLASGGSGNFSYAWNPVYPNSSVINNAAPGMYSVVVSDENNCSVTSQAEVLSEVELPEGEITASVTEGCTPLCVQFDFQGETMTQYNWNFGDNTSNTIASTEHCYQSSGTFDVSLVITDAQGCSATIYQSDWITVHPQPEAAFTWEVVNSDSDHALVELTNTSTNGASFLWEFPNGTTSTQEHPVYDLLVEGSSTVVCIQLEVTTAFGCADETEHCLEITQELVYYVPNAFTPDGDEYNNLFQPVFSSDNVEQFQLLVFDRWGELIFESSNPFIGWDGTYAGRKVPDGLYTWQLTFQAELDNVIQTTGHVAVLR